MGNTEELLCSIPKALSFDEKEDRFFYTRSN